MIQYERGYGYKSKMDPTRIFDSRDEVKEYDINIATSELTARRSDELLDAASRHPLREALTRAILFLSEMIEAHESEAFIKKFDDENRNKAQADALLEMTI